MVYLNESVLMMFSSFQQLVPLPQSVIFFGSHYVKMVSFARVTATLRSVNGASGHINGGR